MSTLNHKTHLSFQAKVLLPVVSVMVLLLAFIVWTVSRRLTDQLEEEAKQTLTTAQAVFRNSFDIRTRNLMLRYQNIANEPRFKAVAQLSEPKTMAVQLNELLDEIGPDAEVAIFTTDKSALLGGAKRKPQLDLEEFRSRSLVAIKQAEEGVPSTDTIALRNGLFEVVTVPVFVNNGLVGVLTIGVRVVQAAAQELKLLTRSEIAFVTNGTVPVSTLTDTKFYPQIISMFQKLTTRSVSSHGPFLEANELVTPDGRRFLCLAGHFTKSTSNVGYLLLSSFEEALREKEATQRMLALLGLTGILFSSLVIWALLRKITRPLRELRDSAEAVGRGDFSRRVEVHSADEYGELAAVFNNMVENLTTSRAEVEQTLQTLKTTQAQLVQTEKLSAIGEFVAGVTHELNNPLTGVIGFSEMLQESGISDRQRTFVSRIIGSAERCHKIVQNLLSFSRRKPPERKPVSINELIEKTIEIVKYEFELHNIEIITKLSTDVRSAMIDPDQIQQVFLNILTNARQAIQESGRSGRIYVTTEMESGIALIRFRDNGVGIPVEHLKKVFNPFFTTKPVGQGTGLGLSLSYGIIREHQGTITAQSQTGEGATILIQLPVFQGSPDLLPTQLASVLTTTAGEHLAVVKILAIDDEESILELIREALTVQGYQVDTASDGETAIQLLLKDHYDLILCDWKIPGMGGQQIYERLREIKPSSIQRFIFMTGDVLNPNAEQFLQREGRVCLFKPFSIKEFRTTIQKFLN